MYRISTKILFNLDFVSSVLTKLSNFNFSLIWWSKKNEIGNNNNTFKLLWFITVHIFSVPAHQKLCIPSLLLQKHIFRLRSLEFRKELHQGFYPYPCPRWPVSSYHSSTPSLRTCDLALMELCRQQLRYVTKLRNVYECINRLT